MSLIGNVTTGLMAISRQFTQTHGSAVKLQAQLDKIKLTLMAGAGLVAAGAFGFMLIDKAVKPATEYAAQLNRMRMAGMSNLEIARATGDAWRNSSVVMTTTATENLRSILDLKNLLGTLQKAELALPIVSKIGAVMASVAEKSGFGSGTDVAFTMAKALDIIGAARDEKTFAREAGMMSKVITAFQNRVNPRQFQSVFQYARQAKFDLSDEFKYEFLPSLMLEYAGGSGSAGGGSRGVGPAIAAIYRMTNQGYINKKAVPLWEKLGLVKSGSALATSTPGTVTDPLKDRTLAAANPFLWATKVLDPAIRKYLGKNFTEQRERQVIGELTRGNQLAGSLFMEFIIKAQNFLRDQAIIKKAMPYGAAYAAAVKNDPNTASIALHAQWQNALTALGIVVLPGLIKGTWMLVGGLRMLSDIMMKHQTLTKYLVFSFLALSGAMVFGGTVLLLSAAFSGLSIALGIMGGVFAILTAPMSLIVIGLAAFGVAIYALWKNWDVVWPKIKAIWNDVAGFFVWLWNKIPNLPSKAAWHQSMANAGLGGIYTGSGKGSPYVPDVSTAKAQAGHVYMDGKKVGKIVLDHAAGWLSKPASGTTFFDGSMNLAPVSAGRFP